MIHHLWLHAGLECAALKMVNKQQVKEWKQLDVQQPWDLQVYTGKKSTLLRAKVPVSDIAMLCDAS